MKSKNKYSGQKNTQRNLKETNESAQVEEDKFCIKAKKHFHKTDSRCTYEYFVAGLPMDRKIGWERYIEVRLALSRL